MKICSKNCSILYSSKLLCIILHWMFIALTISWKLIALESFLCRVADARCIHDQIKFAIKDQSPQMYETLYSSVKKDVVKSPDVVGSSIHDPVIYLEPDYYYSQGQSEDKPTKSFNENIQSKAIINSPHNFGRSKIDESFPNHKILSSMSSVIETQEPVLKTSSSARVRRQIIEDNLEHDEVDTVLGSDSDFSVELSRHSNAKKNFSNAVDTLYKPIRLKVWYDYNNILFTNTSIEYERLKQGLDRSVEQVVKLFSVIPVKGSLLLKRINACGSYWQDNSIANRKKCGRISSDYRGEKCYDDFEIPDSHLSGFATYNKTGTEPSMVHYEDGEGLIDTDLVVYVRSHNTEKCIDGNTIAYVKECQLDQFNRPIAGYANFCPYHLSSADFDPEKFYLSVLHELFHILGFSKTMFKNFQSCHAEQSQVNGSHQMNVSVTCEKRNSVVDYVYNWHRVLSPSVAMEAARHFNCSTFGGPLEGSVKKPTESSHWESRFFQSSIMTSTIGLPHLTVIDRITLALFNDTGWYKVNISRASQLLWGKGMGCDFGSVASCRNKNSSFFCTTSNSLHGCHYLHLDKGVCKSDEFLDSCKVYKAGDGGECWDPKNIKHTELWKGETFNVNSRCFISNISSKTYNAKTQKDGNRRKRDVSLQEGRCFEHRCNTSNTLEIRVSGSDWVLCKDEKKVQVPGHHGFIYCPRASLMCNRNVSRRAHFRSGSSVCVKLNLTFTGFHDYVQSPANAEESSKKRKNSFLSQLAIEVDKVLPDNDTTVADHPRTSGDVIMFELKSLRSKPGLCPRAVQALKRAVLSKQKIVVPLPEKNFTASKIIYTYTMRPCIDSKTSHSLSSETITKTIPPKKDEEISENEIFTSKISPGVIAAAAVGTVCVTVFAAVWFIIYAKSVVPNAVGPVSGLGPEVSYQPNSRTSAPSISESGSVGQIQFAV